MFIDVVRINVDAKNVLRVDRIWFGITRIRIVDDGANGSPSVLKMIFVISSEVGHFGRKCYSTVVYALGNDEREPSSAPRTREKGSLVAPQSAHASLIDQRVSRPHIHNIRIDRPEKVLKTYSNLSQSSLSGRISEFCFLTLIKMTFAFKVISNFRSLFK